MLAYAEMLVSAAKAANITVPDDVEKYDPQKFPHWHVFCTIQLGAPMPHPTAHWENARVIGQIPEGSIRTTTFEQLKELGIQVGYPTP